jgi:hypothetical protein
MSISRGCRAARRRHLPGQLQQLVRGVPIADTTTTTADPDSRSSRDPLATAGSAPACRPTCRRTSGRSLPHTPAFPFGPGHALRPPFPSPLSPPASRLQKIVRLMYLRGLRRMSREQRLHLDVGLDEVHVEGGVAQQPAERPLAAFDGGRDAADLAERAVGAIAVARRSWLAATSTPTSESVWAVARSTFWTMAVRRPPAMADSTSANARCMVMAAWPAASDVLLEVLVRPPRWRPAGCRRGR